MSDSRLGPQLDSTCETIVLEFERCRRERRDFDLPNVLEYIEPELRPRLAAELACIDLERSCDEGRLPAISAIVWKHTDLFTSEAARAVVAVEHFRLCRILGTPISREAIAKLYNIPASQIPERLSTRASPEHSKNIEFPVAGQVFCSFPLIAELGRGALARVYLAQQPDLAQRLVVLKVTQRSTCESDKLARLQHTGIIPVYSIHKQCELTCICMPYLGALTLANLIDDGRLLSHRTETNLGLVSTIVSKRLSTIVNDVEQAQGNATSTPRPHTSEQSAGTAVVNAPIARGNVSTSLEQLSAQIGTSQLIESLNTQFVSRGPIAATVEVITKVCEALAYAHERSIVHRDLKPENILIANDGQPILLDFNLAASVNESGGEIAGGTLPYMSPQHLRSLNTNGQALASDDVFSVGVLLYQLLTGKLPFESSPFAAQNLEKLAASRTQAPVKIRSLNAAISPSLASIVEKCLAFDSHDRYPSATELVDDLNRYRTDQVLRYASDRSPNERIRKWVRRHPVLTSNSSLLIGFGLIVCALASALMLSRMQAHKLIATQQARDLPYQVAEAVTFLQSPGREPALLHEGITKGQAIVDAWIAENVDGLKLKPIINRLEGSQVEMVRRQLFDLVRMMSSTESQLSIAEPTHREQRLADLSRLNLIAEIVTPASGHPKSGDDPRDLFFQSLRARDDKQFEVWKDLSDQMVVRHPTDPSSWFTLGAARWTLGEFESARHAFDVSEKLQPGSQIATFWRGVCELQLANGNAAKKDFTQCLASRPDWIPAIYNRALAARMLGDHAAALVDVQQIVDLGQGTTRVFGLQSQLQQGAGNEAQAATSRQLAMDTAPKDSEDWATRGMLQLRNDEKAALRDFERALELNPANTAALQNIAHIQSELTRQYDAAIDTLTKLAHLRPNSATPIASRGIIFGRDGQFAAAVADAQQAELLRPNAIEMLQLAGIYALACEDLADRKMQALSWLSKAVAANPELRPLAANDPDLSNIRDMAQFRTLTSQSPN